MGTISVAFDQLAQREVAYKQLRVVRESNRARLNTMFEREYNTLSRLEHPNIVRVYDYGFDDQGPYYTMELLSGEDLGKVAPVLVNETCRILRDIASALSLVHARGMLHRDVTPNNVRRTSSGSAKLIDFGALTSMGRQHDIVGTPAFVAPECLVGAALDAGSDLYSLGALGYWLLTKRTAIRAHFEHSIEAWATPIVPPSRYASGISIELEQLIMSLLSRERSARPASAAYVIERLSEIAQLAPEEQEVQVGLSYLRHPPLRGRTAEVETFRGALDRMQQGQGSVVSIEGVAGVGRTALLDQFAVESQLRGATVLRARGDLQSGTLGVVRQLVRRGLASFPDFAESLRDSESLESIGPRSSTPPAPGGDGPVDAAERQAMRAASAQKVLLSLSLRSSLVLLVDDAETVDAASLALLASMVEVIARYPVVMVFTREPGALQHEVDAKLRASATTLTVAALSEEELCELVRHMFGGAPNERRLAFELFQETGGNPAACFDLLHSLVQHGELRYARGAFTIPMKIPKSMLGAPRSTARLSGLSLPARRLLDLLALYGGALDLESLAVASAQSPAEVLGAAAELTAASLVLSEEGCFRVGSGAVAAAARAALSIDQAQELHLRLSDALHARGPAGFQESCAASWHLLQAGPTYELRGALAISDTARDHSFEAAMSGREIAQLERAAEVLSQNGYDDRQCVHLLIILSISGFYGGQLQTQRRYSGRALAALFGLCKLAWVSRLKPLLGGRWALIVAILLAFSLRSFKPLRLSRRSVRQDLEAYLNVVAACIASAAYANDVGEAGAVARWLAPFAGASATSGLQITRQFCLASLDVIRGQRASGVQRMATLLESLAAPVRQLDERVRTQLQIGCLYATAHVQVQGAPEEARAAADKVERASGLYASHAEVARMACCLYRGEAALSEHHRSRAETLALRNGLAWGAMTALALHSLEVNLLTDDAVGLVRTLADLDRMRELSTEVALYAEVAQAHLWCLRAQPDRALEVYPALLAQTRDRVTLMTAIAFSYSRALVAVRAHAQAKEVCETALTALDRETSPSMLHLQLWQQLGLAEAAMGDFGRAEVLLNQSRDHAEHSRSPLARGLAHRACASVAIMAHDAKRFEEAHAMMCGSFLETENALLIEQGDALAGQAVRAGLRAPSGAPHEADNHFPDTLDDATFVEAAGNARSPR